MAIEASLMNADRVQAILDRARRLGDAHEYEAVLELLDEFLPDVDENDPALAQLRAQMLVLRGKARHMLGQWLGADDDVRAVLGLATHLADRSLLVSALLIMGELQKDRGELPDSKDTYLNASRVAEATQDRYGGAEANLALAAIFSRQGEAGESQLRMQATFAAVEGMQALPRACRILAAATTQKAVDSLRRGSQEETVALCRRALELMAGDPLAPEAAEAHRFLGVIDSMRMQHKDALEHHLRALDVYKKLGYRFGQAKIYNSIGQTLLAMARSDEALYFMQKAERICGELGALAEAATLYGKLGQVYLQKEDYARATEYFEKDLQLSQRLGGKRALAYIHRNIGLARGQSGETTEAIGHFKESLQMFQQVGDELNTGKIYMDLCRLYVNQKNFERARGMAQWANSLLGKLKQTFELASMKTLLGMILRAERNFGEAETQFKEAVEFFNFREPTDRLVETLYEYGLLLVDMGKRDRATEQLLEALKIARGLGLKQQAARCFAAAEHLDEVTLIRTLTEAPS